MIQALYIDWICCRFGQVNCHTHIRQSTYHAVAVGRRRRLVHSPVTEYATRTAKDWDSCPAHAVPATGLRQQRSHLESWPYGQDLAKWYIHVYTMYRHVYTCTYYCKHVYTMYVQVYIHMLLCRSVSSQSVNYCRITAVTVCITLVQRDVCSVKFPPGSQLPT